MHIGIELQTDLLIKICFRCFFLRLGQIKVRFEYPRRVRIWSCRVSGLTQGYK